MAGEVQDKLLIACPRCLTANRVPAARLGENPKCGKCSSLLVEGRPETRHWRIHFSIGQAF